MTGRDKVERAPERIWAAATPKIGWTLGVCSTDTKGVGTEYVRSDLFTALQAERDVLLAKVRELGTEGHAYRRGKLAGYEAGKLERDALREALTLSAAALALVTEPDAIKSTTSANAFAECFAAATVARAALRALAGERG